MNVKPHSENSNFFRIGNHSVASLVNTNDLIAHLRVLSAFHGLKAQVKQDAAHRGLDPIRSWVQYIEHAVERFHNWACRLSDREMSALQSEPLNIDLGILMVWHTYLLNPHTYLRDSLTIYPALTKLGAFPLTRVTADPIVVLESFANATNFQSPSSINMVEAVIRQESFIEKMVQLGWASNPSETLLTRCVTRYHSFLDLIASGTVKAVVPTLDIDLAWHTHQLQGSSYRVSTKKLLGFFLNHDDSIPKDTLDVDYTSTSEAWQERYKEAYKPGSTVTGCGSGGCNGECGSCGNMAGCGGGCNGECGSCGTRFPVASCSGACSGKCGTVLGNASLAGCGSGGCNGECGTLITN